MRNFHATKCTFIHTYLLQCRRCTIFDTVERIVCCYWIHLHCLTGGCEEDRGHRKYLPIHLQLLQLTCAWEVEGGVISWNGPDTPTAICREYHNLPCCVSDMSLKSIKSTWHLERNRVEEIGLTTNDLTDFFAFRRWHSSQFAKKRTQAFSVTPWYSSDNLSCKPSLLT